MQYLLRHLHISQFLKFLYLKMLIDTIHKYNSRSIAFTAVMKVAEIPRGFRRNRMTLSRYLKWIRDFVHAQTCGCNVRYRRNRRAHSTRVAVFGGFILRGDRYGRVGDKYPSDIMDGICIRP